MPHTNDILCVRIFLEDIQEDEFDTEQKRKNISRVMIKLSHWKQELNPPVMMKVSTPSEYIEILEEALTFPLFMEYKLNQLCLDFKMKVDTC